MMSDNPFELSDADENEGSGASETSTIQDLRKYAQRQEKAVKAAEKELAELRAFREEVVSERREQAITSAFTEVGLNPAHAKLYKAVNPQIDLEAINAQAVAAFAAEYGLAAQTTGEVPAAPEPAPSGYTPVTTQTSAAPLTTYTEDEIQELIRKGDFETVSRARKEGRIVREAVPWRVLPDDPRFNASQ